MARSFITRTLGAATLAGVLAAGALTPAAAAGAATGGAVGGTGNEYHLANTITTHADVSLVYGRADDAVYTGDWDGDGADSLAVRRGSVVHVRDALSSGPADAVVSYGRAGDVVLTGDWDGDGRDTLAVRRGNVYHLRNALADGPADRVVAYGRAGDEVLVGDWDGDGRDTLAVRRGNVYHLRNALADGPADRVVAYGRAGDDVLVGDWDGDGRDTIAVRRGNAYHLRNALADGPADRVVHYGRAGDATLVGDWDGDGTDTLGVRRGSGAPAGAGFSASVATVTAAQLGASWRPGCPVAPADLRAVRVTHRGYDGAVRTGEIIVAAHVADRVVAIFRDLFTAGFPVQRMEPVSVYGADDDASMAANNTSAFNCRAVTGGSGWSEHSFGTAIDVNPLVNPYVRGTTVLPEAGRAYTDRSTDAPGMIHAGDEVVRAFAARGFAWGGAWASPKDYQHFSLSGR